MEVHHVTTRVCARHHSLRPICTLASLLVLQDLPLSLQLGRAAKQLEGMLYAPRASQTVARAWGKGLAAVHRRVLDRAALNIPKLTKASHEAANVEGREYAGRSGASWACSCYLSLVTCEVGTQCVTMLKAVYSLTSPTMPSSAVARRNTRKQTVCRLYCIRRMILACYYVPHVELCTQCVQLL